MSRLIHYSKEPLGALRDVEQGLGNLWKPRGLWLSVEGNDDWLSWCRSERFALEHFAHAAEITLSRKARILRISTIRQLDAFDRTWALASMKDSYSQIAWAAIAISYDGIIIAPYCWERRLTHNWYYSWDCASGCIWSADAIAAVTPIEAPDMKEAAAA